MPKYEFYTQVRTFGTVKEVTVCACKRTVEKLTFSWDEPSQTWKPGLNTFVPAQRLRATSSGLIWGGGPTVELADDDPDIDRLFSTCEIDSGETGMLRAVFPQPGLQGILFFSEPPTVITPP